MNPERPALLFDWRRAALISSAHPRTSNDVLKRSKPLVAPFATSKPIDVRYFFTVLSKFFFGWKHNDEVCKSYVQSTGTIR